MIPKSSGDVPKVRGTSLQVREIFPQVLGMFPEVREIFPEVRGMFPQVRGIFPKVRGKGKLKIRSISVKNVAGCTEYPVKVKVCPSKKRGGLRFISCASSLSLSLSLSLCKCRAKPCFQGVKRDKYLRKSVHFSERFLNDAKKKNIF